MTRGSEGGESGEEQSGCGAQRRVGDRGTSAGVTLAPLKKA